MGLVALVVGHLLPWALVHCAAVSLLRWVGRLLALLTAVNGGQLIRLQQLLLSLAREALKFWVLALVPAALNVHWSLDSAVVLLLYF